MTHFPEVEDPQPQVPPVDKRAMAGVGAVPARIAILTGGGDRPYALGLASALIDKGVSVDFIGSDELYSKELDASPNVRFLNLRGSQKRSASTLEKTWRVLRYYVRLVTYAATTDAKIFHLLWNNKFEFFDRTLLMLFYRVLRKKVVLTVHNVNAGKRDRNDSWLNRISLKCQYGLVHHCFVHTRKMKEELMAEFMVCESRITIIPFGINNTLPNTSLTSAEARAKLGISATDRTMLFFGNIAPYKGLGYLVTAFAELIRVDPRYRLIIAGSVKSCEDYWRQIERMASEPGISGRVQKHIRYIPDEEAEVFLKAADLLVLPYTHVFQSGVLFLGYSFGLPVLVTDVGSLRDDVQEGQTGFVCAPANSSDLARMAARYFESHLFGDLKSHRQGIQKYANDRYSWETVAQVTADLYSNL